MKLLYLLDLLSINAGVLIIDTSKEKNEYYEMPPKAPFDYQEHENLLDLYVQDIRALDDMVVIRVSEYTGDEPDVNDVDANTAIEEDDE